MWLYPIKALRGIELDESDIGAQGLKYDRRFMICRVQDNGDLKKVQLSDYPQCGLFRQEIVGRDTIHVRYLAPEEPLVPQKPEHDAVLHVPLEPSLDGLERAEMNLHNSVVSAYRMGSKYDDWFSACFGFTTVLLYIGDQRRPVLGTFSPKDSQPQPQKGWLSSIAGYLAGSDAPDAGGSEKDWITFTDMAPFMITTEASLANVQTRLAEGDAHMFKFRPNIVVDGEHQWEEDFWSELSLRGEPTFTLSKMCGRCTSLNVDYDTGRSAQGEEGALLKKLMSDRRVDAGNKYSPVFGRYAFLTDSMAAKASDPTDRSGSCTTIRVGDDMAVLRRNEERPAWDWPMKDPSLAQYYQK